MTETLRSRRLPFRVLETARGASPVGGRAQLHRQVWRLVCDEDLTGAIIIEDGARLRPGFVGFLDCGGYLHADLTQFCYGKARIWLWGGCEGSPGVTLRPLAASNGLASGYAVSRRGAARLAEAASRADGWAEAEPSRHDGAERALAADWPCDVTRMGALVTGPKLVEPPAWLADAAPAARPATAGATEADWRGLAATAPVSAAGRLRDFARNSFSRELSPGF